MYYLNIAKAITARDLVVVHVPQIKGLTVKDILAEARKFVKIDDYMPNLGNGKQPDRDFTCNIGRVSSSLL